REGPVSRSEKPRPRANAGLFTWSIQSAELWLKSHAPWSSQMAQPEEPLIRNISDTALWVAVFRARETERQDALFRDPFARKLAGERGEQISKGMQAGLRYEWPYTARTLRFDQIISEHIKQ